MRNHGGFTLIELIVVMILLGILSVYAAPRLSGMFQDYKELSFADLVSSKLALARESSMSRNAEDCSAALVGSNFAGIAYFSTGCQGRDATGTGLIAHPTQIKTETSSGTYEISLNGVSISSNNAILVLFDGLGEVKACGIFSPSAGASIPYVRSDCKISLGGGGGIHVHKGGFIETVRQ